MNLCTSLGSQAFFQMVYWLCKQTVYYRESGFCVYRENPGA